MDYTDQELNMHLKAVVDILTKQQKIFIPLLKGKCKRCTENVYVIQSFSFFQSDYVDSDGNIFQIGCSPCFSELQQLKRLRKVLTT